MTRNETNGPMSPAQATKLINEISKSEIFGLALTKHAEQQMDRRNLIMDDVLHVLKHGFVYADGESTTRRNSYKYGVEGSSPNSMGRKLKAIIAFDEKTPHIVRLITIMWVDGT